MTSSLECSPSTGFPISAIRLASSSSDVIFLSGTSERRGREGAKWKGKRKKKNRNLSEKDGNQNKRMLGWLACCVVLHSTQTETSEGCLAGNSLDLFSLYCIQALGRDKMCFYMQCLSNSCHNQSAHSEKLRDLLQLTGSLPCRTRLIKLCDNLHAPSLHTKTQTMQRQIFSRSISVLV